MRKFFISLFLLCFSVFAYAKPVAEQPLTVVLDWLINPSHAPLLVAEQQGFFKQEGLKVTLVPPSDTTDGPKLVAAKKADIAITYQPSLLLQVEHGLPLMRIGALVPTPLNCLVALESSDIQTINQLKHKAIGYSSDSSDRIMLATMLQNHKMTLSDVSVVNVHYDLVRALLSGNVSAFTGGMRNIEPVELQQMGYPVRVFYPEDNGFPTYEELIFVVHRDAADDPRLSRFLKAVQRGAVYLKAHPRESWASVIKQHPELDNPMNQAAWQASVHYFSTDPAYLDVNKYQKFAAFMQAHGFIKKAPTLSSYAVIKQQDS